MPTTALTVQAIKSPFAAIAANGADITFTAADVGNGNHFACDGKQLLIAHNSDESNAYTVTITSVDDEKGRSEDITNYSLAAGEYGVFGVGLTTAIGWRQTTGVINVSGSNAAIKFAVLTIPL